MTKQRRPRRHTCCWLVLVAVMLSACGEHAGSPRRANVVLITLDTTRADRLGCYGYPAALTPRLDSLAKTGVRFDAAYTPSPMTLPAHATIMTGRQPPEHGVRINGRQRLPETIPTVASQLRTAGYRTAAFVAAYVLSKRFGLGAGFEIYDDDLSTALPQTVHEELSVHRAGDAVVAAALPWLTSVVHDPDPFFLWVHFYDPHYPHHANATLAGTSYANVESYDAEVAFMDLQVGKVIDALQAAGVAEDTLVVAVGDHGEGLGDHQDQEHGYLLNEEVLHVPLLVRWPRAQRAGLSVPALVGLADVAPTILDVTGTSALVGRAGRSLRGALAGEPLASQPQYGETDLPYWVFGWSPLRSIVTEQWKYVRSTRPELYERGTDRPERQDLAANRPEILSALDTELVAIESGFAPVTAPRAVVDAAARAKLEALGYLDADPTIAPPPARGGPLRDVKDMLAVKQLGNEIAAGQALGRFDAATVIAMSRELVRQSPESASFQFRLGTRLLEAGQVAEAVTVLAEAVRLRPDQAEAQTNLAQALTRAGRLEDAVPHFRAAIAIAPDLAEAPLGLGTGLAGLGRLDEAFLSLSDAVRLAPTSADARLNLGNVLLRRGDDSGAITAYREALRLRPDFALAHHALATVLARSDDVDEALGHAREAVRLAPSLAIAYDMLGRLLVEAGAVEEAITVLQQATHLDVTAPEFADDLAAAYAAAGKFPLAVTTARVAMRKANGLGRPQLAADIRGRIAYYRTRGGAVRSPRQGPP